MAAGFPGEQFAKMGYVAMAIDADLGTAEATAVDDAGVVFFVAENGIAASDEIAVGVMEAARARGLGIPEDLSIVGFDDTQLARMSSPPLTTVRQPLAEMGRVAVRTALRLIEGESIDSHHVELATELVVRESAVPPPATSRARRPLGA